MLTKFTKRNFKILSDLLSVRKVFCQISNMTTTATTTTAKHNSDAMIFAQVVSEKCAGENHQWIISGLIIVIFGSESFRCKSAIQYISEFLTELVQINKSPLCVNRFRLVIFPSLGNYKTQNDTGNFPIE